MLFYANDWGNYQNTLITPRNIHTYPSLILYNRELKVMNTPRLYDFTFEYNGIKGISGTLAQDEKNELDRNRRGDSKYHQDALIRLLIGLHQFADNHTNIRVVVGQPISTHKKYKEQIKRLLENPHTITVNDITKTIHITEAIVGVEGACAIIKEPGLNHIIDIGSGTMNFATVENGRFISEKSTTVPKGIENLNHDYEAIAYNIENIMIDLSWKKKPYLGGGGAYSLKNILEYPVFTPLFRGVAQPPELATAIGLYQIGEIAWKTKSINVYR